MFVPKEQCLSQKACSPQIQFESMGDKQIHYVKLWTKFTKSSWICVSQRQLPENAAQFRMDNADRYSEPIRKSSCPVHVLQFD